MQNEGKNDIGNSTNAIFKALIINLTEIDERITLHKKQKEVKRSQGFFDRLFSQKKSAQIKS